MTGGIIPRIIVIAYFVKRDAMKIPIAVDLNVGIQSVTAVGGGLENV